MAFTGGWERELKEFENNYEEFQKLDTQVWAVSIDLAPSQKAFADHCGLSFKAVSGFPNHDGAKTLGAFNDERGLTKRITYVVDKEGILRHIIDDPGDMERHARESLEVVKGL